MRWGKRCWNTQHINEYYTSIRSYYMHNFSFVGIVFQNSYIPVTWKTKYVSGNSFPKITLHVLVCDSENYMEKKFGIIFLVNLISNVFGSNFTIISSWSVFKAQLGEPCLRNVILPSSLFYFFFWPQCPTIAWLAILFRATRLQRCPPSQGPKTKNTNP